MNYKPAKQDLFSHQTETMKPIHILLVEDNEGDILLTKESLESSRIINTLSVVKDGKEAIDFLNKEGKYADADQPDLLLLDINLPKMNGFEVLQFVKETGNFKHIFVTMLTTSSFEKDIEHCKKKCANFYITKPVDPANFLDMISKIESFWISIVKLPAKITA